MDVGDLPNAAGYAGSGAAGPPVGTTTGWWTPTSTTTATPANTDVMNQLCRVCGEPAAGFHFGAFTCEGCKSFFGRTYNNLGSISECKNGGVCVINKKNRTACKACRLRKCLMVGMSKSGSRYGRRSNWFKIHCLLQEQSNQAQTRLKDPKSPYEKVFSSLDAANNNNNTNNFQERLQQKREEGGPRPRELSLGAREMSRQADLARPHELLRPEASRFPMWRGPPFFHPALTHMQLLNAPFFPFQQQRFVVPYVNQVGVSQAVAVGLSSSSSESVSPRSTPSPKPEAIREDPRAGRTANAATTDSSYDKSLAFLRSLGPEQEEPIDLSRKTGGKPEPEAEAFASGEERSSDGEDEEIQEPETGPPLDLTRKT